MSEKETASFYEQKVNISEPLKILGFLKFFQNLGKVYSMHV